MVKYLFILALLFPTNVFGQQTWNPNTDRIGWDQATLGGGLAEANTYFARYYFDGNIAAAAQVTISCHAESNPVLLDQFECIGAPFPPLPNGSHSVQITVSNGTESGKSQPFSFFIPTPVQLAPPNPAGLRKCTQMNGTGPFVCQ